MTNQMISASATSLRESSRQHDGKFGTQPAAEAEIELVAEDTTSDYIDGYTEGFADGVAAAGEGSPERAPLEFRQANGRVFEPEMIQEHAKNAAEYWVNHYNVTAKTGNQLASADDIASESVLAVMKMLRKAEEGGKPITDMRQAISSCAANHAVRATAVQWKPVDRAAYVRFTEDVDGMERELSRPMTQREKDALAEKIRENWHDPRHRPSKDFRVPITVDRSLDRSMTGEVDGPTMGDSLVADGEVIPAIQPGTFTDEVLTLKEQGERSATSRAHRMAYNAFAEQLELPLAKKAVHSPRAAAALKKSVENGGGLMPVLQRWEDGERDEATEAAFALFDVQDDKDREDVSTFFRGLESKGTGRAKKIWEYTLAYTSTAHKD